VLTRQVARLAVLGFVAGVAACGPTPAQLQLNSLSQACSSGDRNACAAIPAVNAQAQYEQQQQTTNAAVAAGAVGALGGVALGAAAANPYYYHPYHYYGYRPYYYGW
jgi:hypothetical protein